MKSRRLFMTTLMLSIAVLLSDALSSQTFEWAKAFGDIGSDFAHSIASDSLGNVYVTGRFSGSVDFNPGQDDFYMSAGGSADIYVLKLNEAGGFVWAVQFKGDSWGEGFAVETCGKHIYITGGFQGVVDFNPDTLASDTLYLSSEAGSVDIFLCKLDSSGNLIWAGKAGGMSNEYAVSLNVSSEEDIQITGSFVGSIDVDIKGSSPFYLNSNGDHDAFICMYDSSGSLKWATNIGGVGYDNGECIKTDLNGNVYTLGLFNNTVDFDPGSGFFEIDASVLSADVYILKLNKHGDFLNAYHFTGPYWEYAECIDIDLFGNVYCAGKIQGTVDFNPAQGIADTAYIHTKGAFICKMDSLGNLLWVRHYEGECMIYSIAVDNNSCIYATGDFNQTVDFDPGNGIFNLIGWDSDIFITKLDTAGNFNWALQMAGYQTYEYGRSLALWDNAVFTVGGFNGLVDFDPDTNSTFYLNSGSSHNFFVHKLFECNIDTSVSVNGITLTANSSATAYQWLNCDDDFSIIPGETYQSFTADSNGNYAVILSYKNCVDTSACYNINNAGIYVHNKEREFNLYPNPASGEVYIDMGEIRHKIFVQLTDIYGRKVREFYFESGRLLLMQLEGIPKGMYVVDVNSEILKLMIK